jgi:hypothetical protein
MATLTVTPDGTLYLHASLRYALGLYPGQPIDLVARSGIASSGTWTCARGPGRRYAGTTRTSYGPEACFYRRG